MIFNDNDGKSSEPIQDIIPKFYRYFTYQMRSQPGRDFLFVFDNLNKPEIMTIVLQLEIADAPRILIASQSTEWDTPFKKIDLEVKIERGRRKRCVTRRCSHSSL